MLLLLFEDITKFSSTLQQLNGTQEIIDLVDDRIFERFHPNRRHEILNYYRTILHVNQNLLSCLIGEFYFLVSSSFDFPFIINGRLKTPFSFWSKLTKTDETIYDILSLKITVETIDQCYPILNILQNKYPFEEIIDYIKYPKSNGYQSIHIILIGPKSGKYVEVKIITNDMYQQQRYGSNSHWLYKGEKYGESTY
ncbi:unnamed protein product [Rotaria sp. Silwood2]|nr:unnamed protein product [Rotaria sp. Silwood2]CAF4689899.1 unnamed protein product [Rotaria sp. Silwood2]